MSEYGNFIRRADLIKNLVDREKLAEQKKKPNKSIQEANRVRFEQHQNLLRHELAARIAAAAATGGPVPPSLLFANAEKGGWFDASDITTLFQDAAGTTPVTAVGQPVGRWLDKSGNGNHATQTVAAQRPIYQIDSDGYANLTFDGTNDFLSTPTINFTSTAKMTVGLGINVVGSASAAAALSLGNDISTVNGTFLFGAPSATADHSLYLRGSSTLKAAVNNVSDGDDIIIGLFDISQATKELEVIPRLNKVQLSGSSITWTGTDAGTGNFSNQPLYIGSQSGSSLPFNGKVYQVVVRGAASTDTQVLQIEEWIDSRLGE
jgi:hypothetical protein